MGIPSVSHINNTSIDNISSRPMPKSTNPIPKSVPHINNTSIDNISSRPMPKSTNPLLVSDRKSSDRLPDVTPSLAISKCTPNSQSHLADVSPIKLNPSVFPSINNESFILPEDSPYARPSTSTESTLSHHDACQNSVMSDLTPVGKVETRRDDVDIYADLTDKPHLGLPTNSVQGIIPT